MKANEAPEKIYLDPNVATKRADEYWWSRPMSEKSVEYIRTDVFIEKAERYIRSVADGLDRDDDVEAFIKDFKKYMKGE